MSRSWRTEDHPFQVRLGDQQAIERIVVMRRQAAGMLGMGIRHRHDLEAEHQHRSDDRSIEAKLPDRSLDRDFPNRRRADDNLARLITHRRAQPRHDPAGPLTAPPGGMGGGADEAGPATSISCHAGR